MKDWPAAAQSFDAVATERLTTDDLAAYADALWWLGRVEHTLRVTAATCDAFEADSRPAEAAWAAATLGVFHLSRGDEPLGMGWIGRARRLLEGGPECPAHALLLHMTEVEPNLLAGRPTAAVDAARRIQDLGRRLAQLDLVVIGLNGEGRALIRSGHVVDGLRLLDEAMVTVLDGRLSPFTSGTLYCHTIAACQEVADVRRMTRWTEMAEQWLATLPVAAVFGSMCQVHRAQLQLLCGRWDEAEHAALQVAADLDEMRVDYAAEAWYVVAEARRLRCDPGAEDAYDEAHARGRDPQPGRALLQLQGGDTAGAATSVRTPVAAVLRFVQGDQAYQGPRPTDADGLRQVAAPVLLLRGQRTRLGTFFADAVRYLAQHIPDAEVRELPGVGHFAPLLEPEAIADELITFVESIRQPA